MIPRRSGRALVLGLGSSGFAAARLLTREGWSVTGIDDKSAAMSQRALDAGIAGVAPALTDSLAGKADVAVVSPGIPVNHPWLAMLQQAGVTLLPEFEFGLAALGPVRVVAVTGSNGKSSLVKWIADTLTLAGISSVPAGNYGLPPSEIALSGNIPDVLVLELSSFQLEQARNFSPDIGVLLNLAPNHLDRHGTMENYRRAKARLFANMNAGSIALVHAPAWQQIRTFVPGTLTPVFFDSGDINPYGTSGASVRSKSSGAAVDLSGTWWGRDPLLVNAASAFAVFEYFGIPPDLVRRSAKQFSPLPHRLERLAEKNGVEFVNDSKCSTLTALAAAVAAGSRKKHLIAGGILKESDPGFVKELLAKNCAFVYCIGVAAQKLIDAWRGTVPCENCGTLTEAFSRAVSNAVAGETVLLSPGCSSFDQFSSYAQRGDFFRALVASHVGSLQGR